MDNELRILVERLERIFPHVKLYYEGETFPDEEKFSMWDENFAPPCEYDWYDLIRILKENGLEIKNINEKL